MITLIVKPKFNFQRGIKENGIYQIILPQIDINIIIFEMECSSIGWASTDLAYECVSSLLDELLEGKKYKFVFDTEFGHLNNIAKFGFSNEQIDLSKYYSKRVNMKLPPWTDEDKYQFGF